jgi:two-component system sensor histidine kinase HydH
LNSHLKEMNLAAAGLAHETRNPLNIIRGQAQMISKPARRPPEIREKSRAIVDETDKVTAQLNEFINYSRPREVRRTHARAERRAVNEVVRTLELRHRGKKIARRGCDRGRWQFPSRPTNNCCGRCCSICCSTPFRPWAKGRNKNWSAAPKCRPRRFGNPRQRPRRSARKPQEIFKPYFTTHVKGTGLGLAVVQQIVLAHGWEIACLPNEPKGAVFRIAHLKLMP